MDTSSQVEHSRRLVKCKLLLFRLFETVSQEKIMPDYLICGGMKKSVDLRAPLQIRTCV